MHPFCSLYSSPIFLHFSVIHLFLHSVLCPCSSYTIRPSSTPSPFSHSLCTELASYGCNSSSSSSSSSSPSSYASSSTRLFSTYLSSRFLASFSCYPMAARINCLNPIALLRRSSLLQLLSSRRRSSNCRGATMLSRVPTISLYVTLWMHNTLFQTRTFKKNEDTRSSGIEDRMVAAIGRTMDEWWLENNRMAAI